MLSSPARVSPEVGLMEPLFSPLPQSPESFLTSPFSFLTLIPEWGPCMELSVLVGSPLIPSHTPPPVVLCGLMLILSIGRGGGKV